MQSINLERPSPKKLKPRLEFKENSNKTASLHSFKTQTNFAPSKLDSF